MALWIQDSQCHPSRHNNNNQSSKESPSFIAIPTLHEANTPNNHQNLTQSINFSHGVSIKPKSQKLTEERDLSPCGMSLPQSNQGAQKPLTTFFQNNFQFFRPEKRTVYITTIFSKSLENLNIKERDDGIVFLMDHNISPKVITTLFHVHKDMIDAFGICRPLDPKESFDIRQAKAIELLKNNHGIKKISYIVHIGQNNIKKIATKENIKIGKNVNDINAINDSLIPLNFLWEMDKNKPIKLRKNRALSLLKSGASIEKIKKITHLQEFDIKKLAEKYGIAIEGERIAQQVKTLSKYHIPIGAMEEGRKWQKDNLNEKKEQQILCLLESKISMEEISNITNTKFNHVKIVGERYNNALQERSYLAIYKEDLEEFSVENEEYMYKMPVDSLRIEKQKRAILLLKSKVPLEIISKITYLTDLDIKKLAERNGFYLQIFQTHHSFRKNFQAFDSMKEKMTQMLPEVPREEREKRALFLLCQKIPVKIIVHITHITCFDLKKLAEKNGITLKMEKNTFEVPYILKKYMEEMPKNTPEEEKEKRAFLLLKDNIPIEIIEKITHMNNVDIQKLAEKKSINLEGFALSEGNKHDFRYFNAIREYLKEMPKDAPEEKKQRRILFLLKNSVFINNISKIVHIDIPDIKAFAKKNGISIAQNTHDLHPFNTIEDYKKIAKYIVEMPKDAPKETKEERAIFLLEKSVPIQKISIIVHMGSSYIKQLAEKNDIPTRKNTNIFKAYGKIREYMMKIRPDISREEKKEWTLFLLKNKVPMMGVSKIVNINYCSIKKLAEKHGLFMRENTKTFQVPYDIKKYMIEMPRDASKEEKEKRTLLLLKNKVPMVRISKIVHINYYSIKKLAEKYNIFTRDNKKIFVKY